MYQYQVRCVHEYGDGVHITSHPLDDGYEWGPHTPVVYGLYKNRLLEGTTLAVVDHVADFTAFDEAINAERAAREAGL